MLFYETPYENVLSDETGQMWPLGADDVTKLRNSGQVVARPGGGGGGAPPGLDPRGRSVQAVPAAAGGAPLGGMAPMGPPTPNRINPQSSAIPPREVPPGLDPRGRSVQAVPGAASALRPEPAAPMGQSQQSPSLQRVMPSMRSQQRGAPEQQRYYQRVGSTPEAWVPTGRQTSGISQEQQDEAVSREKDLRLAQIDAAKEQVMAMGTNAMADRYRAERDALENQNKAMEEQAKLDTQNLYIESQQQKVAKRLNAARSREVDPNRQFKSAQGGLAGVLAVLGAGLGQYSSGINGGPNNALQLFNNMVERDVNEQLRLIEEEKDGALMSKAELDDFQFRTNEEKKALIRSLELERKAADLRLIEADRSLVATHPLAKQLLADIDERTNQNLMTINSAISRTAAERFQPAQRGGVVDITGKVLAKQAQESGDRRKIAENERVISTGGGDPKEAVKIAGEVLGHSPNAPKLNSQYAAYERFKGNVQEALDMIENGSFLDDSRYGALINGMMFDLAESKGTTIRSDTDVAQFEQMLGGTSRAKLRPENQKKILRDALRRAGSSVYNEFKREGISTAGIEPDETLRSE
jgi:hypothetical protein